MEESMSFKTKATRIYRTYGLKWKQKEWKKKNSIGKKLQEGTARMRLKSTPGKMDEEMERREEKLCGEWREEKCFVESSVKGEKVSHFFTFAMKSDYVVLGLVWVGSLWREHCGGNIALNELSSFFLKLQNFKFDWIKEVYSFTRTSEYVSSIFIRKCNKPMFPITPPLHTSLRDFPMTARWHPSVSRHLTGALGFKFTSHDTSVARQHHAKVTSPRLKDDEKELC